MFGTIARKRRWAIAALVLWFAAWGALAGCGKSTSPEFSPGTEAPTGETPQPTPAARDVVLATTTSTQDTGLLDYLVPIFEEQTGYKVKVVAVGTGQALEMGKRGEADVLLTHAPSSEKPLVDDGTVTNYRLVMHNDFVLVGPPNDPAKVEEAQDLKAAMKAIAASGAGFVSRGDDSGTHKKELDLWKAAGVDPKGQAWYTESGTGMGQTLLIANERRAYTLTDRGTYLAYKDRLDLAIVREGDEDLLNIYHVMQVNAEKYPKVNAEGAKAFVEFLVSPETQKLIGEFGVDKYGQPLFFPDAAKEGKE
ncbi:MAG: substrate-binding domain-containing protein [Brockia lithotrophica]|nr:substrate-binding domain-containing protein [Brockia lithotrophica]